MIQSHEHSLGKAQRRCHIDLQHSIWHPIAMDTAKKITVHVPPQLLARAQEASGKGITETVRQGLELLAAREAYAEARALRGKVQVDLDLEGLREDRP